MPLAQQLLPRSAARACSVAHARTAAQLLSPRARASGGGRAKMKVLLTLTAVRRPEARTANGLLSAVRTAEAAGADGERAKLGLAGAQSRERAGRSWAGRPRGHGARRSSGPRRGSAGRETVGRSWSFVLGGRAQWRKTAPRRRVGASAAADRGDDARGWRRRRQSQSRYAVARSAGRKRALG